MLTICDMGKWTAGVVVTLGNVQGKRRKRKTGKSMPEDYTYCSMFMLIAELSVRIKFNKTTVSF